MVPQELVLNLSTHTSLSSPVNPRRGAREVTMPTFDIYHYALGKTDNCEGVESSVLVGLLF